jgi:hypothetical protein
MELVRAGFRGHRKCLTESLSRAIRKSYEKTLAEIRAPGGLLAERPRL